MDNTSQGGDDVRDGDVEHRLMPLVIDKPRESVAVIVSRPNHHNQSNGFLSQNYFDETILVCDTVPDHLKQKIWNDKMIDFEDLLSPNDLQKFPLISKGSDRVQTDTETCYM